MAKKQAARKIDDWTVRTEHHAGVPAVEQNEIHGTRFDELLVGDWLHMERMDERVWWIGVGDTHITIMLDRQGRVSKVSM